jgi:hypothetical protein
VRSCDLVPDDVALTLCVGEAKSGRVDNSNESCESSADAAGSRIVSSGSIVAARWD